MLPPRIERKIDRRPDGCWHWTAGLNNNGYGRCWWQGRTTQAHRVVYELLVAPIPEGMEIDHLCRVSICCNPEHLEPVTPGENLRRANEYRRAHPITHCKRGHEFTPENTYISRDGRVCKTCRLDQERIRNGSVIRPHNKCKQGHEYTPENTLMYKGTRLCLICKRAHGRKNDAIRRANGKGRR